MQISLFCLLIIFQVWGYSSQLCLVDHHILAKDAYFVTCSATIMTQSLTFPGSETLHVTLSSRIYFAIIYHILLLPVLRSSIFLSSALIHTPQPGNFSPIKYSLSCGRKSSFMVLLSQKQLRENSSPWRI